jgi:hypothetical protein
MHTFLGGNNMEEDCQPYRLLCDVGTGTDDLYYTTDMTTGHNNKQGFRFETPVWDKYVKDCWERAQSGIIFIRFIIL